MVSNKLFHVLVVGGALLGAGCREEGDPARADGGLRGSDGGGDETDAGAELADAALPTDATMTLDAPADPGVDGGELVECGFCPNPDCCVPDGAGGETTRPGFVCCWSTSC